MKLWSVDCTFLRLFAYIVEFAHTLRLLLQCTSSLISIFQLFVHSWNIKPRSCWEWNFVGFNTVSEIHDTRCVNSHLSFIFVVVFFVILHRCASPDRSTTTTNIPTFTFFSSLHSISSLSRNVRYSHCVSMRREMFIHPSCDDNRHPATSSASWPPSERAREPSHEWVN